MRAPAALSQVASRHARRQRSTRLPLLRTRVQSRRCLVLACPCLRRGRDSSSTLESIWPLATGSCRRNDRLRPVPRTHSVLRVTQRHWTDVACAHPFRLRLLRERINHFPRKQKRKVPPNTPHNTLYHRFRRLTKRLKPSAVENTTCGLSSRRMSGGSQSEMEPLILDLARRFTLLAKELEPELRERLQRGEARGAAEDARSGYHR